MKAQPMASGKTTMYIVQAFCRTSPELLDIESPRPARNEEAALAMAQQLTETKQGVIVFSREMDYVLGEYGEPQVLASLGDVPDDVSSLWES